LGLALAKGLPAELHQNGAVAADAVSANDRDADVGDGAVAHVASDSSARTRSVSALLDVVRALLQFNQLGVEDGFSCFDSSGTGSVLLPALAAANEQLRLEMSSDEVSVLYAALGVQRPLG